MNILQLICYCIAVIVLCIVVYIYEKKKYNSKSICGEDCSKCTLYYCSKYFKTGGIDGVQRSGIR